MTDEPAPRQGPAARAHQALVALLAALALGSLALLLDQVREGWQLRTRWQQVPAVQAGHAGEGVLEVEVAPDLLARLGPVKRVEPAAPYRPDHVRILVPEPRYAGLHHLQDLTLAIHPNEPGQLRVVDWQADLWPTLSYALWAVALGLAARAAHRRLPWGRDLLWSGQGWGSVAFSAQPPGGQASEADTLHESAPGGRWAHAPLLVFGGLAAFMLTGAGLNAPDAPLEAGFCALAGGALLAGVAFAHTQRRSRRVRFDAQGVADSDWFTTRRVPYGAIARFERENVNRASQDRYDSQSSGKRKGRRPADLWKWQARAADGTELLSLPDDLEPAPAMRRLRDHILQRLGLAPAAADVPAPFDGGEQDLPDATNSADLARLQAEFDTHHGRVDSGMKLGFWIVCAPFILMLALAVAWSMKFQFGAERVPGTVVAHTVVGKDRSLVQLTVAFKGRDGKEHRLETDGTRGNREIPVGSSVPVLMPPDDPDEARIAGFWSVWLWPVVFAVLLAIVAIPFGHAAYVAPRREAARRAALRSGGPG